jgi:hypothetical protein
VKLAGLVATTGADAVTANTTLEVNAITTTVSIDFLTTAAVATTTDFIAGCAANATTAPAVILKVTETSTTASPYTTTITQFGSVATKTLKAYDPTGCVAGNVLLVSSGSNAAGLTWTQIGVLVETSSSSSGSSMTGPATAVLAFLVSALVALMF